MSNKQLAERLRMVADQIENNPTFLSQFDSFMKGISTPNSKKEVKEEPFMDIWDFHAKMDKDEFLKKLNELNIGQLVKIIQKNGLDQSKLSHKWKNKEKLIELIKERILDRTNKGKIFLEYGKNENSNVKPLENEMKNAPLSV